MNESYPETSSKKFANKLNEALKSLFMIKGEDRDYDLVTRHTEEGLEDNQGQKKGGKKRKSASKTMKKKRGKRKTVVAKTIKKTKKHRYTRR